MSQISLGRKEQLFVQTETTFGQSEAPTAAGAIRHLKCEMEPAEERLARDDRKSTRGLPERLRGKRGLEWSLEGYLIPSGDSAVAPDIADLLAASFSVKTTNAATVASDPTTTGATLSAVSEMEPGDLVGFEQSDLLYVVCLQTVDAETKAVTWTPALPQAPQVDDDVAQAVIYRLQTDPADSLTIHRVLDHEAETAPGCVPHEWEFTVAAGDVAKFSASGAGRDLMFCGSSALAEGIDDEQTSFTYDQPDVFQADAWVQIDSEVLKITAVDTDTNTCTVLRGQCGSDAASHDAEAEIVPDKPTPATAGSPIAGVEGRCAISGEDMVITAGALTVAENPKMRNDQYGQAVAAGFCYPQGRTVKLELEGFLSADSAAAILPARTNATVPVLLQAGREAGKTFAFYAAAFSPDPPKIEAPADGEISLKLSGPALEDEGNDEVVIAFL